MDLIELVLEAEDRFGVDLPDSELGKVHTVRDLAVLVCRRLGSVSPEPDPAVLEAVRKITAEQLAINVEKVRPETDFVRDLGAD